MREHGPCLLEGHATRSAVHPADHPTQAEDTLMADIRGKNGRHFTSISANLQGDDGFWPKPSVRVWFKIGLFAESGIIAAQGNRCCPSQSTQEPFSCRDSASSSF